MNMDEIELDDLQLDEEEREILEAYESGKLVPAADKEAVIARLHSYAEAAPRKERRVNIRLSSADLAALQNIALEDGIPYQTLMSSILHKYVTGRLVERPRQTQRPMEYAVREESDPYDG